jgi:hypothetical protein
MTTSQFVVLHLWPTSSQGQGAAINLKFELERVARRSFKRHGTLTGNGPACLSCLNLNLFALHLEVLTSRQPE